MFVRVISGVLGAMNLSAIDGRVKKIVGELILKFGAVSLAIIIPFSAAVAAGGQSTDSYVQSPKPPVVPRLLAITAPDTNVKLFSTNNRGTWTSVTLLAQYEDWNKQYYRVVQGGASNQAAFYNRDQDYVRIIQFTSGGEFSTLATHTMFEMFDEHGVRGSSIRDSHGYASRFGLPVSPDYHPDRV